jgi:hypothetical protein
MIQALGLVLNPQVVPFLEQRVCQLHNTYCASSPQYVDVQDCVSFLQTLPVGTFDRVNSNTRLSCVSRELDAFHSGF